MRIGEYYNNITKDIDKALGLKEDSDSLFKSYIMDFDPGLYSIRVPGRTIGDLRVDDNMIITSVVIGDDTRYKFNCDINEQLKKYVGTKLELEGIK